MAVESARRRSNPERRTAKDKRTDTADRRLQQWERTLEWPLLGLSVIFLVAYAVPIVDPSVSPGVVRLCDLVVQVTWVLFAAEYQTRLVVAQSRARFVRRNLFDLAVFLLPVLRPLRLLRFALLLSVLNRAGTSSLRGKVAVCVAGSASLLVLCAGQAFTEAERGQPEATVEDVADGLWWAITTMTTVGYGDRYPVTGTGRLIAVALMVGGVALLGVVTASLASWMVERVAETAENEQTATRSQVAALQHQVEQLRSAIAALAEGRRAGDHRT